jgi:peptide deformylase
MEISQDKKIKVGAFIIDLVCHDFRPQVNYDPCMKTTLILTLFFGTLSSWASTLEIIKIGHPTLRATAEEVSLAEIESTEFQKLIDDMITTMGKAGGVGLAAPQVNKSLRLFVMKSWPNVPLTVVINPKIEYLDSYGKKSSTEGCLSIPGKSLKIERFKRIHLSYFNRHGDYITEEVTGFKAVIAQHEYDHLNGVLIVDLIQDLMSEINYEKYAKVPLM